MNLTKKLILERLKEKDPKEYRRLKAAGELEAYLETEAEGRESVKEAMIRGGMREFEANEVLNYS